MDIEKEARTWIKDNYPLMNADDFNDCEELDVYDMISFAKHIQSKLEQRSEARTHETKPTDEEIAKWVKDHGYYGHCTSEYHEGLEEGAKWVRDLIRNTQ